MHQPLPSVLLYVQIDVVRRRLAAQELAYTAQLAAATKATLAATMKAQELEVGQRSARAFQPVYCCEFACLSTIQGFRPWDEVFSETDQL